jgi:hypothetical protein
MQAYTGNQALGIKTTIFFNSGLLTNPTALRPKLGNTLKGTILYMEGGASDLGYSTVCSIGAVPRYRLRSYHCQGQSGFQFIDRDSSCFPQPEYGTCSQSYLASFDHRMAELATQWRRSSDCEAQIPEQWVTCTIHRTPLQELGVA